jgi:hypothetical protein
MELYPSAALSLRAVSELTMSDTDKRLEMELIKSHLLFAQLHKHVLVGEPPKEPARPPWQVILESSVCTALITVLLGGIMAGAVGQYLSYRYQKSLRERDIATTTYEGYLKRGDETITSALVLIGSVLSASEDLMAFAKAHRDADRYPPTVAKRVEAWREELLKAFGDAMRAWRARRDQQGLLLQHYHNGSPELVLAWRDLQKSVTVYVGCTQSLFWRRGVHEFSSLYIDACIGERHVVERNIDRFTAARLAAARKEASLAEHH